MTRPAFATDMNKVEQEANRLSIATAAMTVLLSQDPDLAIATKAGGAVGITPRGMLAFTAFRIADAMLTEAAQRPDQRQSRCDEWDKKTEPGLITHDHGRATP